MELNATLFIQIINFFIAWLLLRMLYFKPAIAFLERKQDEQDRLAHTIRRWQNEIQIKEQEVSALWRLLRQYSSQHKPDTMHSDFLIFKYIAPSLKAVALDTEHVAALTKEIKQKIMLEAAHVDL